jgi:hypothetical protein
MYSEGDSVCGAHFVDTSTLTGFVKLARCSFATFVVIVAENKYVVRSVGIILRILSRTAPKSRSSNLSASSSTYAALAALYACEYVYAHQEL